jgi:hypothetical protein
MSSTDSESSWTKLTLDLLSLSISTAVSARIIIQADGDVICICSKAYLEEPADVTRHLAQVEERLGPLRQHVNRIITAVSTLERIAFWLRFQPLEIGYLLYHFMNSWMENGLASALTATASAAIERNRTNLLMWFSSILLMLAGEWAKTAASQLYFTAVRRPCRQLTCTSPKFMDGATPGPHTRRPRTCSR